MTKSEVWKDITGYEGFYKVSNRGNVYSVERKTTTGRKCGGRTLRPRYDKDGYLKVGLCKNGKMQNKFIHRLVAEAFIPNIESLPQVNHRDEVKDNNNVENLEWCTSKYNNNHGTRIKRIAQAKYKKVRAVNIKTGEVLTFSSVTEAVNKGYSRSGVSAACNGIYKSGNGKLIGDGHLYRGYKWSHK